MRVLTDSQLVVKQVESAYRVREPVMAKYLAKLYEIIQGFHKVDIRQLPRSENAKADTLSKLASSNSVAIS